MCITTSIMALRVCAVTWLSCPSLSCRLLIWLSLPILMSLSPHLVSCPQPMPGQLEVYIPVPNNVWSLAVVDMRGWTPSWVYPLVAMVGGAAGCTSCVC